MKALVADDETILTNNIKICIEQEEFEGERFDVDIADNGEVALRLLKEGYDLVILDLSMPEVNGINIIEAISLMEPDKQPIIILITAHPNLYRTASTGIRSQVQEILEKPFEVPELVGVVRRLLKSRRLLIDAKRQGKRPICNWSLTFSEMSAVFIQVSGIQSFADSYSLPWTKIEEAIAGNQAALTGELFSTSSSLHRYHKSQAKIVGSDLYNKLFLGSVQKSFIAASSAVLHNEDLKLTFVGPGHYLKLPLEFLHDGSDYLVLRHPMKRFITRIPFRRNTGFIHLFKELQESREKIKILLIASNTEPKIDEVDEEVEAIRDWIIGNLPSNSYMIDYLPSNKATFEEVVARLRGCKYHILHYAGHGHHDENFPEKSSLFFWEKKDLQGKRIPLYLNTMKNTFLMKEHNLRFIYLSCCFSSAISNENTLVNDNFLGMADGLVLAGVPSVLGFRWPVSDEGAKNLAMSFYESLFSQGSLDTALFVARCRVAGTEKGQHFGDWLSPILIVQAAQT